MSNNYLQLKSNRFSRYNNFVYIDTTEFLADRIFIENKVRVKFCGDYKHREKKLCCRNLQSKEKRCFGILAINGRIGKQGNSYGEYGL